MIFGPSRSSRTGTIPAPVSSRISPSCSGPASTNADPSVGCPANASSSRGVKMRIRACPPASGLYTKTVSLRFSSRAIRCSDSSGNSRACVKSASSSPATGSVRTRCCRARCFAPARPQRRSPKRRARARRPTSVLHPEQPPSPCALRSRDAARRSSWSATSRTAARSRPRSAAALSRSSRPPAYASSSSEPLLVAPPPAQVPVEEVDPVRKRVGRRAARLDRPEERQRLLRLLDDLTDVREPLLFVDEIGEEHLQQSLVTRREPQRLPRRQPVAQRTPAGRGDAVLLPPTRPALLALDQTRTLEPLQLRIDLAVARAPEERGRALDGPLDVVARTLPEGDHPEHDLCRWTQLHISGRYISKWQHPSPSTTSE